MTFVLRQWSIVMWDHRRPGVTQYIIRCPKRDYLVEVRTLSQMVVTK